MYTVLCVLVSCTACLLFFPLVKEDDSSDSHVNKSYLESKTSPNEESFELDELEGSGEAEEPSEWEESEDLEEKSHLGGDQEMREEESASDDEGETGDESGIDEDEDEDEETDSGPDLARGKGNVETSSEDEEENDLPEIFPRSPEVVHEWGELAKDAPRTDKVRLTKACGLQRTIYPVSIGQTVTWLSLCNSVESPKHLNPK